MKKITSLVILSMLTLGIKAQNIQTNATQGADGNWQPVVLTGGSNNANGVEASYRLSTSNGNNVVIIKLVNHNTYAVKARWNDIIITKNGQHLSGNNQDSATIAPKVRVSDDIPNTAQVEVKLSDFHIQAPDFKGFTVSGFDAIATN